MPRYNLTALRLYIGALDCSVPSPVRYSQARTFSTIITTIQMKEDIVNTSTSPKENKKRLCRGKSHSQPERPYKITGRTMRHDRKRLHMSCAYNFKPKARLTKEEAALLQNLDNCRSDLVKYTSALHGMSTKQRMVMFNQIPFMVGWLGELSNVAEGVCQFLEAVKEKNKIPSNPQSEEK